jgi:hypothetical protein
MADEPPDYIDWGNARSGSSFFGCIGVGLGFLFMFTGGACVLGGFSGGGGEPLLIGLLMMAGGWVMMKAR